VSAQLHEQPIPATGVEKTMRIAVNALFLQ